MAKFLARTLRRIMVFSGRSRFGGDGDKVHFTCGSVRGPWREGLGGSWGDEPWTGSGARTDLTETWKVMRL